MNNGILVPVLVAVLSTVGSLAVAFIGGWFLLRGKRVDGPQTALNSLLGQAPALLTTNLASLAKVTELTQTINDHLNTIESLRDEIKGLTAELARTKAECGIALQAQAQAEGRLEGYLACTKP